MKLQVRKPACLPESKPRKHGPLPRLTPHVFLFPYPIKVGFVAPCEFELRALSELALQESMVLGGCTQVFLA